MNTNWFHANRPCGIAPIELVYKYDCSPINYHKYQLEYIGKYIFSKMKIGYSLLATVAVANEENGLITNMSTNNCCNELYVSYIIFTDFRINCFCLARDRRNGGRGAV